MWKCPPAGILVPVDFGDASARAAEVAGAMQARLGASVRLLHAEVLEAPAYFTRDQITSLERQRQAARSQAESYIAAFGRRHGLPHAGVLLADGSPVPAILTAAADSDLVVMGTHGRHGASRWWLGSVAERVVHESRSPVLVVHDAGPGSAEAVFARPLVVAAEAAGAEGARRVADGLASAFGGRVADAIATCERDLARHREATLIVVARHGRDTAERWLRSCTLPMLFVPEP
ncbi:MAG: Universal stress protein [Acidobacteria bacterium]|nr:Universal stress protein [Acidobacteriota bacterium]